MILFLTLYRQIKNYGQRPMWYGLMFFIKEHPFHSNIDGSFDIGHKQICFLGKRSVPFVQPNINRATGLLVISVNSVIGKKEGDIDKLSSKFFSHNEEQNISLVWFKQALWDTGALREKSRITPLIFDVIRRNWLTTHYTCIT
ncbi:hypothetical protein ACJX0J_016373, partial [Zea mays]